MVYNGSVIVALPFFAEESCGLPEWTKDVLTWRGHMGKLSRREIREQIFKILFQIEFHSEEELEGQTACFLEEELSDAGEDDRDTISAKVRGVCERLEEIDALINEKATGWRTGRMAKVDLTLIRLAAYEIRYDDAIPTGVAINEAVEIAKKYGSEGSAAFVNGVLAKLV